MTEKYKAGKLFLRGQTKNDGKVQSGEVIFARANEKGFSASALMMLASCPMRYFLSRALGLGEPEEALSRQELAPNLRGSAYHEVLAAFYGELVKTGALHQLFADGLRAQLKKTLFSLYPPNAYKRFGIYPVIWDLILELWKNSSLRIPPSWRGLFPLILSGNW